MGLNDEDRAWLARVYSEQHDRVFRTCLRFAAGDRAWALDRMQDAFVMMARELGALRDRNDPGGWLYRAAINACLMSLRRGRVWGRIEKLLLRGSVLGVTPDRVVRAQRDVSKLEQALAELPNAQRAAFVLVELEGHSQKEAAALMRVSKGQLSKLHTRAFTALRRYEWDVADD